MSCTTEILGVQLGHHSWRHRVSGTERRLSPETDMWGRVVLSEHVFCHKQDVCEECGATREGSDCTCDPEEAAHCPRLLASIGTTDDDVAA